MNTAHTWPRYVRWAIAGVVAICLVVGGIVIFVVEQPTNDSVPSFARGNWQPPPQTVLKSPMRIPPVPGWRVQAASLGLPESSIIGTTEDAAWSTPLVGFVKNNVYFLASNPHLQERQHWLIGLDAKTGNPLFAPVQLDLASRSPKCFLNGPESLLCLADDVREGKVESVARVIDAHTGVVSFTGPTDLHTTPGSGVRIDQVGIFAIAELAGRGIYGIGSHAETTWSLPGATKVSPTEWASDAAPPTLATAMDPASGLDRMVVFSLTDGKVITANLDEGQIPQTAVAYPGGFAVEATTTANKSTPDVVVFFDVAGNRLGETKVSGFLDTLSMTLPIVEDTPMSTVFGANGAGLIQVSERELKQNAVLIGHRLFTPESNWEGPVKVRKWKQFDLTTGEEATTCRPNISHYIANDGSVGIFATDRSEVTGATTFAMDLATCEKLWSVPVNPDSYHRLWRIDDTLVELSDDGKELHSLVAPA
ncbi:hypothetical protein K1X22_01000 [Mycolicibacterium farcinogenes]|uniref:hypothetical protein n=1 Tax=Mycolicibacterium farcinogenes TaxID=1802 RepID=UPI001C8DE9AC|nr:hypothetical protein [Mycolicibacterium farcinogenes]QZH60444.1 hypothetical protein K1X22_01000 [Mycolicibacterium farcinogenes]